MITAALVGLVVWCALLGRVPSAALIALCAAAAALFLWAGRHRHGPRLSIDVYAQASRLNDVSPALKFWTALILMALCIAAKSPLSGLIMAAIMLFMTVFAGGLKLHDYVQMLALPVSFLMVSALALLFEATPYQTGIVSFPAFGAWLCVSAASQARAALIISRALGALSCLYLLSLTTPLSALIGVLRRARMPGALISLMYLIYRYIFILMSTYHTMKDAAASRLGFNGCRTSVRTTAMLYGGLLSHSYRQAGTNYDAMESRCYDTDIRFLERTKKIELPHAAAAIGLIAVAVGMLFI